MTASDESAPNDDPDDAIHWMRQRLAAALRAGERGEEDPVRAALRPRRQREAIPMDDRKLERVAGIYNEAAALRQAPNKAVQDAYDVSRATASRWVRRARDLELIPDPGDEASGAEVPVGGTLGARVTVGHDPRS